MGNRESGIEKEGGESVKLDIYGVKWELRFVPKDHSVLANRTGFCTGVCLHRTQEIFIADGQTEEAERNTICHEIAHAVLEQMTLEKENYDGEDMAKFVGTYAHDILELTSKIIKEKGAKM